MVGLARFIPWSFRRDKRYETRISHLLSKVWLSLTTVALYKTPAQNSNRPIGIEPCLARSDIKNVFNSVSRAQVIKVLDSEEELRHLSWHAALSLASFNALESDGQVWGHAQEGATQGDPEIGTKYVPKYLVLISV